MKCTCIYCNNIFKASHRNRKFCSRSCSGKYIYKMNPEWKGRIGVYASRFIPLKHFNITNKCTEYFDGMLLGDGCIPKPRVKTRFTTRYAQTFGKQYEEWATIIKNDLLTFGIESTSTSTKQFSKQYNKFYYGFSLQTKTYVEFYDFYTRWYPNGIKIVPKDIELTPIVLKNWFLGDGSQAKSGKGIKIKISSEGFDINSVELLKEKLFILGFDFKITKDRDLYLYKQEQVHTFFNMIGEFPLCFEYKRGIIFYAK